MSSKQMHNPKGKSQAKSKDVTARDEWKEHAQNSQSCEKYSSTRGAESVAPDCCHQKCCILSVSDLVGF